jgi:hypothetical protein
MRFSRLGWSAKRPARTAFRGAGRSSRTAPSTGGEDREDDAGGFGDAAALRWRDFTVAAGRPAAAAKNAPARRYGARRGVLRASEPLCTRSRSALWSAAGAFSCARAGWWGAGATSGVWAVAAGAS